MYAAPGCAHDVKVLKVPSRAARVSVLSAQSWSQKVREAARQSPCESSPGVPASGEESLLYLDGATDTATALDGHHTGLFKRLSPSEPGAKDSNPVPQDNVSAATTD
jgi:hypothetical protein